MTATRNVTMRIQDASRSDVIFSFFEAIRALDRVDKLSDDDAQPIIDRARLAVVELRRRAVEKGSIEWLREAHVLASELNGTIIGIGERAKERLSSTGLLLPGQR